MVRIHALKTLNDFLRGIVRNSQKIAIENIKSESNEDEIDLDELRDRVAEYKLENLPVELITKLIIALRDILDVMIRRRLARLRELVGLQIVMFVAISLKYKYCLLCPQLSS